jgi:phosphatidylinositol 4-kinase
MALHCAYLNNSLELNIHQQILSDIASNARQTKDDLLYAKDIISSKTEAKEDLKNEDLVNGDAKVTEARVFMVRHDLSLSSASAQRTQPVSMAHCNIAFGELVINFPDDHISENIETLIPVLVDMLDSVPNIDFDQCLSWQGRWIRCEHVICLSDNCIRLGAS